MLLFSKVDCSELPEWAAAAAGPVDLGRGCRFWVADPQRTTVDFAKLRVSVAHFDQDCRGLWQGKPLYFSGSRCSRLWKMTAPDDIPIHARGKMAIDGGQASPAGLATLLSIPKPKFVQCHARLARCASVRLPSVEPSLRLRASIAAVVRRGEAITRAPEKPARSSRCKLAYPVNADTHYM
jgi:hypothetical protein